MADCCSHFKELEHVIRNSVVIIVQHQKAIQKELAKIDTAMNSHKCNRIPPEILTKDIPDFLRDLFR